jgi:hypothetical protein
VRAYLHVTAVTAVLTTIEAVDLTCSDAIAMSLSFSWTGVARCSSNAPTFTLSDVPPGTSRLSFNMIDLNLPSYPMAAARYRIKAVVRSCRKLLL